MSLIYFWNGPSLTHNVFAFACLWIVSLADPLKADLPQYCKECKFHEIPPDIKEVGVKHFWEKLQPNPFGNLKGGERVLAEGSQDVHWAVRAIFPG